MKNIHQLNKSNREIIELLLKNKVDDSGTRNDAMFSKKPYGPASCASCEKGLTNMYGHKVDHHSWNKLPFREPGEPIARYGKGFSRVLSQVTLDEAAFNSPSRSTKADFKGNYQTERPSYRSNSQAEEP